MRLNMIAILVILFTSCNAQNNISADLPGYKIEVDVKGLSNENIFIANYIGDKMYYTDTAMVDSKGHAIFEDTVALEKGKYAFVFPNFNFLYFLVDEQHFSVKTDTLDYYQNAEAKDSPNNSLYFDYFRFLADLNKEKSALLKEKNDVNTSASRLSEITDALAEIDKKVKAKLKKEHESNKGTFYATVIGMIRPIDVPDAPEDAQGNIIDSTFRYNYYKKHYFDNVDFKEPAIYRTPEFHAKLDEYFNRVIPQVPDSMPAIIDRFVPNIDYDPHLKSFALRFLAANFKRSKYMGMETGFVHVVSNYFDKEDMADIDPERIQEAIDEAKDMKHTLLGKIAPDIKLHDPTITKFQTLHELKAPYTLLYIWSPTCSHCLEENPDVVDFYNKYHPQGIEVFSICADQELEDWKKYLQSHPDFAKMINLADSPGHRTKFRNLYNSRTTPVVLLLDENKKILTKRLNVKQVGEFLDALLKK